MPVTPTEWKNNLTAEDLEAVEEIVAAVDKAMMENAPASASETVFNYRAPTNAHVPNARVQREVESRYQASDKNPGGWTSIKFQGGYSGGCAYMIQFFC